MFHRSLHFSVFQFLSSFSLFSFYLPVLPLLNFLHAISSLHYLKFHIQSFYCFFVIDFTSLIRSSIFWNVLIIILISISENVNIRIIHDWSYFPILFFPCGLLSWNSVNIFIRCQLLYLKK